MQEGKSVEEIAKELQPSQLENVEEKEEEKVEEKTEEKVFVPKPAVDAEGKVISLDSNWKSFLVKKGKNSESKQKKGKIAVKKEKKVEIKNKNVEKASPGHTNTFDVDPGCYQAPLDLLVNFVFDHMGGIEF